MTEENKNNNNLMAAIVVALLIVLIVIGILIYQKTKAPSPTENKNDLQQLSYGEDDLYATDNGSLEVEQSQIDISEDATATTALPVEQNSDKINSMMKQEKLKMTEPKMTIDKAKTYTALLKTSEGDIKIKLNADKTPITVNNFVYLARAEFYNETIFHRVISGFMIQGGDPLGNGTGSPAYKFDDEKFEGEYKRGTIAMANSGPNTNGSQFFIMHQDNPLPKNYVIFGEVVEGLDVVDKIAMTKVMRSATGEMSTPVTPISLNAVEITEE